MAEKVMCSCGKHWAAPGDKKCRKCLRAEKRKDVHREYLQRQRAIAERHKARLQAKKVQKSDGGA